MHWNPWFFGHCKNNTSMFSPSRIVYYSTRPQTSALAIIKRPCNNCLIICAYVCLNLLHSLHLNVLQEIGSLISLSLIFDQNLIWSWNWHQECPLIIDEDRWCHILVTWSLCISQHRNLMTRNTTSPIKFMRQGDWLVKTSVFSCIICSN